MATFAAILIPHGNLYDVEISRTLAADLAELAEAGAHSNEREPKRFNGTPAICLGGYSGTERAVILHQDGKVWNLAHEAPLHPLSIIFEEFWLFAFCLDEADEWGTSPDLGRHILAAIASYDKSKPRQESIFVPECDSIELVGHFTTESTGLFVLERGSSWSPTTRGIPNLEDTMRYTDIYTQTLHKLHTALHRQERVDLQSAETLELLRFCHKAL